MTPSSLEPLLPPGEEIDDEEKLELREYQQRCSLKVDGLEALRIRGDVITTDMHPFEVERRRLENSGNPSPAHVGQAGRIADDQIITYVPCTFQLSSEKKPAERRYVLDLYAATDTPENVDERREALVELAKSLLPKAKKEMGCSKT
ncbi:hypothetical protein [Streptomyces sulphureus]|uniref:hypothetical protein n=1 Tax=Streptomyces sulphureus TaxID=47758 RepID=UPI00039B3A94|nr:hypothetical protein [Streptomyces sulphureus]